METMFANKTLAIDSIDGNQGGIGTRSVNSLGRGAGHVNVSNSYFSCARTTS